MAGEVARRAIDSIRIEVQAFVDDDTRPKSAKARERMLGYVDERIRTAIEKVADAEIAADGSSECHIQALYEMLPQLQAMPRPAEPAVADQAAE